MIWITIRRHPLISLLAVTVFVVTFWMTWKVLDGLAAMIPPPTVARCCECPK